MVPSQQKKAEKKKKRMKTIAKNWRKVWHLYGDGNTSNLEIKVKEHSLHSLFLIQAPNFVGIFTIPGWSFPDIEPSSMFQFQPASSEWNFQTRDPSRSYFSSFFRFKVPITNFFFIFSHLNLHIKQCCFPKKKFWFWPAAIFFNDFFTSSKFAAILFNHSH